MLKHWITFLKQTIFLVLITLAVSCCGSTIRGDTQQLILCGRDGQNNLLAYQVFISETEGTSLGQVIELPGQSVNLAGNNWEDRGLCPKWIGENLAWLYDNMTDKYERDVYLVDFEQGKVRLWFHLSGNDSIEDITLFSGSPRALVVSSRDQDNTCSEFDTAEKRWACLYSKGDIYVIDEQGTASRLTIEQSPLCTARWNPDGDVIVFRQAAGCVAHVPEAPTKILLWDLEMGQTHSLDGWCPQWSPNGEYLSFCRPPSSDTRLSLFHIFDWNSKQVMHVDDGSHLTTVDSGRLQWSPDSQWLAWSSRSISSTTDGNISHWWMNVYELETESVVKIPAKSPSSWHWSLSGENLAWWTNSSFYYLSVIDDTGVYSVPVGIDELFSWTFDGTSTVYIDRSRSNSVFTLDRDSGVISDLSEELSLDSISWLQVQWVE